MTPTPNADLFDSLTQRLAKLEATQAVRQLFARYMQLCDVPRQTPTTVKELQALFSRDAVWEGVGSHYQNKFGCVTGREAIGKMLMSYLPPNPHFIFNSHFLTSEQISGDLSRTQGQWLMQQLSIYQDGSSELIVARLSITFVVESGDWLIERFQTERLNALPVGRLA